MEEGAQDDMDMPDAMIIGMLGVAVVDKEIDARGIGDALQQNQYDGCRVDALAHRGNDIKDGPP